MPFPILFGMTVTTVLHYHADCDGGKWQLHEFQGNSQILYTGVTFRCGRGRWSSISTKMSHIDHYCVAVAESKQLVNLYIDCVSASLVFMTRHFDVYIDVYILQQLRCQCSTLVLFCPFSCWLHVLHFDTMPVTTNHQILAILYFYNPPVLLLIRHCYFMSSLAWHSRNKTT